MNTTVKKVAIYARVSTDKQDERTQLHDLREACRSRGWVVAQTYIDHGCQGDKKRPQLEALLKAAAGYRPGFHAVVVWDLTRFSRSRVELDQHITTLREADIGFVSLREGVIDTTTATGDLIFAIFAALAQFEKALICERRVAQVRASKARGDQLGRRRGFDLNAFWEAYRAGHRQRQIAWNIGLSQPQVSHHVRLCRVLEDHYQEAA